MGTVLSILSGVLKAFNIIADFITAERLKQVGINEQLLEQERKINKINEAADEARKNPPPGNIIDHL